jgi:hypothetical protein
LKVEKLNCCANFGVKFLFEAAGKEDNYMEVV